MSDNKANVLGGLSSSSPASGASKVTDDATLRPLWNKEKPASPAMVWLSWVLRRATLAAITLELLGKLPFKDPIPYLGIRLEQIKTSVLLRSLAVIVPEYAAIAGNFCARYADLGWVFTFLKTILRPIWQAFAELSSSVFDLITTICGSFAKGFLDALPVGPEAIHVIFTFVCISLFIVLLLETIGALKKIDIIRFSFWMNLSSSESFTIVRWFTTLGCFLTTCILEMDVIRQIILKACPFLGELFRNFGQGFRYMRDSIYTFFIRTPRQAIVDSFSAWFVQIKRISELWTRELDAQAYYAIAILICLMILLAWALVWFIFS